MRAELYDLNVIQGGAGAGASFPCRHLWDKWFQIVGIAGGGTYKVEGSLDGVNWVQSGANIVADSIVSVPEAFDVVRINRTVAGTGNPTLARLVGRNERA